jgi:hypothetical protein
VVDVLFIDSIPGLRHLLPLDPPVKTGISRDGPFGEAKKVISGYWIIVVTSLEEAVAVAAKNHSLEYGIICEIRPMEPNCASAYGLSVEDSNRPG